MSIVDDVRINQTFDPKGDNGGYSFEVLADGPVPKQETDYFKSLPFVEDPGPGFYTPKTSLPFTVTVPSDKWYGHEESPKGSVTIDIETRSRLPLGVPVDFLGFMYVKKQ